MQASKENIEAWFKERGIDARRIPAQQLQFCKVILGAQEGAFVVENNSPRRGERGRITAGPLAGIEGELFRIRGHKRVLVRLYDAFSLVTEYVPKEFVERMD